MARPTRRTAMLAVAGAALGCSPRGQAQSPAPEPSPPTEPLIRRPIPSSGETLPVIGLGTWQAFDVTPGGEDWTEARAALEAFVGGGGAVVDSSPMYGAAEAAIGRLSQELKVRDRLFLATKVWTSGREAGEAQMRASAEKLAAPVIDLMQVHNLLDVDTHLSTLAGLKQEGRVRYVGVTHYEASAYPALEAAMTRHRLDFVQVNYSALEREAASRILPLARERGMAVIVNRPFAGGEAFRRLRAKPLPDWAGEIGAKSWGQVLLKFILSHPAVTCAIPGTRNPRHVVDNLGAGVGTLPDAGLQARIAEAAASA